MVLSMNQAFFSVPIKQSSTFILFGSNGVFVGCTDLKPFSARRPSLKSSMRNSNFDVLDVFLQFSHRFSALLSQLLQFSYHLQQKLCVYAHFFYSSNLFLYFLLIVALNELKLDGCHLAILLFSLRNNSVSNKAQIFFLSLRHAVLIRFLNKGKLKTSHEVHYRLRL